MMCIIHMSLLLEIVYLPHIFKKHVGCVTGTRHYKLFTSYSGQKQEISLSTTMGKNTGFVNLSVFWCRARVVLISYGSILLYAMISSSYCHISNRMWHVLWQVQDSISMFGRLTLGHLGMWRISTLSSYVGIFCRFDIPAEEMFSC